MNRCYGFIMTKRMTKGDKVTTVGERRVPDGEVVEVFEDYGMPAISVRRANGQLHDVLRANVRPVGA